MSLVTRFHPLYPRCQFLQIPSLSRIRSFSSSSPCSQPNSRPRSSAQPASSIAPYTASTSTAPPDNINPPKSTRPADLTLPEPLSPDSPLSFKLKRFVTMGRAYLSFYKTGLKNVYHNYRASIPLRRNLRLPVYLPTSPSLLPTTTTTKLSRSNFQLIRRAAYDVRRLIPFTLILLVCGEMTPLAILFVGNAATPRTCRIPSQLLKTRQARSLAKSAALTAHQAATSGSVTPVRTDSEELDLLAKSFADKEWIARASREEVLRACAVFGLVKNHARPEGLVEIVYRKRLGRYAKYLASDDGLLVKGGGVNALEAAEVRLAVEERGGVDVAREMEGPEAERELRRWLESWLERRV